MIKTKKQMFILIGSFILVILLGTVTYAFFNYTRTGTRNVIKTGRIYFSTSQEGTLNLTNVFPVASNSVGNDYTVDTLGIAIEGDTTYSEGIEYLVTAEEVNVETSSGKKVPMTLKVAVTDDLGTQDTDNDQIEYFTDRGSTTSYYKLLSESVIYDGQYLLVGYIAPGQTGIDGTINIKAYLDEDRVAISDTYPEGETSHIENKGEQNEEIVIDGYNGTTSTWVDGRVVLTTSEWNSLQQQGNELSFKVKVEANEGIWVDPATPINAVGSIPANLKANITEIYFIKETPIRMQQRYATASVKADMTDTTLNEGTVLAWQEGNKLYIASSGETYLPADSTSYFGGLANVTKIEFENVNTSRVTIMVALFYGCSGLTSIDLSGFDTSIVTNMSAMFNGSSSLTSIDLSGHGNSNLTQVGGMFYGCTNLHEINMSNFNFGTSSMAGLFNNLTNLQNINLSNANTSMVTDMSMLFGNCSSIQTIDLSGHGGNNLSNVVVGGSMFSGCTNLREINMSGFNFGTSSLSGLFSNLTSLNTVDLGNVNISNVPFIGGMFYGCTTLTTIYVSSGTDWSYISSGNSGGMFSYCSSLVGGAGTTYDVNHVDSSYAHVDGGSSNPGYLTLKTN